MSDDKADDNYRIAVCGECKSSQSESYMNKNVFFQQGSPVPCQFCSGIVIITTRANRERALKQADRERGLG